MVIITNRTMMDVMVIIQVIHVMAILAPMATMAIIPIGNVMAATSISFSTMVVMAIVAVKQQAHVST